MSWFLGSAKETAEVAVSEWKEPLASNKGLFDAAEVSLIGKLLYANQEHLFADWDAPGTRDTEKHDFLSQMARLNETYPGKGGLFEYLKRARELLADSKEGVNPFSGWTPEVAS
jgi:UDP-sugar pyrophosphorylase